MLLKKVSEPVSKKFSTEKSIGIGLEKIWNRKKKSQPILKFFRTFVFIWVPVSSRSQDFYTFLYGIGTGLEKIWYRKKSRNRSQKNEYRKKSRNRSRKILVPKKVSESVSKKFGTEKKSRNQYRSDFGSLHTLLLVLLRTINTTKTTKYY